MTNAHADARSRALRLERGSLLDVILRMKEIRTGLWEQA
jgi:hypothetical protein